MPSASILRRRCRRVASRSFYRVLIDSLFLRRDWSAVKKIARGRKWVVGGTTSKGSRNVEGGRGGWVSAEGDDDGGDVDF